MACFPFCVLFLLSVPSVALLYGVVCEASSPTSSPAPSPNPISCDIVHIIQSAGQFSDFLQLLSETGDADKFQAQANKTHVGITIFVPIDKAFTRWPASTLLKNVTQEQKVRLCEYHALRKWYPLASLQQTEDNITSTYATSSAGEGRFTFNVTDDNGSIEIKTGWVTASIISTLHNEAPCSIFAVDGVLMPQDIFGLPTPPPPEPSPPASPPSSTPSSLIGSPSPGSSSPPALSIGPAGQRNSAASECYSEGLLVSFLLLCFCHLRYSY
ncbi:hypothetical protein KP509_19G073100 [Ceratopteris richardii]|uniref:FAS1 domain-containing protein n=1 Tax=Ceratopteris richardii TaxID=49495 RepID=A0A8T2SQ62_CERRI|nr:hypothetical protein KP509_19G073100 [Ceratopteris richardii]